MMQVFSIIILACLSLAAFTPTASAGNSIGSQVLPGPLQFGNSETQLSPPFSIGLDLLGLDDENLSGEKFSFGPSQPLVDFDDFDIPITLNDSVNRYIRYFSTSKHDVFARWLKRTNTYGPVVKDILKRNGLPEDLLYLAMIESGFNMNAYSKMKAAGPWQFITETGERYGLKVDYWVDERRDLEKSTVAAARYLKNLFGQFGCWHLAAAGYNAGEGRVGKAIAKHDTRDFWKLKSFNALPKETREYVPQLLAAAIIAKDPLSFGFSDYKPTPYETNRIRVPGGISLKEIAEGGNLELTDLKSLNPEMLKGITPPDRNGYTLKLPNSADPDDVSKKLQTSLVNSPQLVGVIKHPMKKKETMAAVLKRYNVDSEDMALLNENGAKSRGKRNRVLYIPRFASCKTDAMSITPVENDFEEIVHGKSAKKADQSNFFVEVDDGETHMLASKKSRTSVSKSAAKQNRVELTRYTIKKTAIHASPSSHEKHKTLRTKGTSSSYKKKHK
jgi:membrane-bound lytic murein transglycosylase D